MKYVAQSELPNYEKLRGTKRQYVRRILGHLLKSEKALPHSKLLRILSIPPEKKSTLSNNLDVLEELGFITREDRGPIRLSFKTPLCFIASTPNVPYAYLGLLGKKDRFEVSETETALKLLEAKGFKFDRIAVVTTQEAVGSWSGAIDPRLSIEWHTLSADDLTKIEMVEERVKPKVVELIKEYVLVMDCTSGPRTAGIAYYRLAHQFKVPLIYVYEPEKELLWLTSRETLEKELKDLFSLE